MAIKLIRKKPAAVAPPAVVQSEIPERPYLDALLLAHWDGRPSMKLSWYLMASYALHKCSERILSAAVQSSLSRALLAEWEDFDHPHKALVSKAALRAGETVDLPSEGYPEVVKHAAGHITKSHWGVSLDEK